MDMPSVSESPAAPAPDERPPFPSLTLDSGAGCHMVRGPKLLSDLRDPPAGQQKVVAVDGNTMLITKVGNMNFPGWITIPKVRLVPGLDTDGLISVRQLARESGITTWFDGDRARMYEGTKLVGIAVAPQQRLNSLYMVVLLTTTTPMPKTAAEDASLANRFDGGRHPPLKCLRCGGNGHLSMYCPVHLNLNTCPRAVTQGPKNAASQDASSANSCFDGDWIPPSPVCQVPCSALDPMLEEAALPPPLCQVRQAIVNLDAAEFQMRKTKRLRQSS